MTDAWSDGATRSREHVPQALVEAEGWAKVRRWAFGGLELIGIGLLVPTAILVVGIPIVLVVRAIFGLVGL